MLNIGFTLEELHALKELIRRLDEDTQVFKISNEIININEKQLKKTIEKKIGDNEK